MVWLEQLRWPTWRCLFRFFLLAIWSRQELIIFMVTKNSWWPTWQYQFRFSIGHLVTPRANDIHGNKNSWRPTWQYRFRCSICHLVTPRANDIHGKKNSWWSTWQCLFRFDIGHGKSQWYSWLEKQLMSHLTMPITLFYRPFGHARTQMIFMVRKTADGPPDNAYSGFFYRPFGHAKS